MLFSSSKSTLVEADRALPGRAERPFAVGQTHAVLGTPLFGPWPDGYEVVSFGLGCFWGAERKFWQVPGVYSTSVGYQGGFTPNATYDEVCSGRTGHTEAVQVVYDPAKVTLRGPAQGLLDDPRPDAGLPPGERRRHAVPLGRLLDHRRAARGLRGLQGHLPGRPRRYGFDPITTDDARWPRVLLRRGLPPAVPLQEPARLRLPLLHRGAVPGGRLTTHVGRRGSKIIFCPAVGSGRRRS